MRSRRVILIVCVLALVATACRSTYDFTGNGKADPVWYDDSGNWYLGDSSEPLTTFAVEGDLGVDWWGVAGDYDGDDRWEPAVVTATGVWSTASAAGTFEFAPPTCPALTPGAPTGALPVPADWSGDRVTEPGWYCTADGTWHRPGRPVVTFGVPLAADGITGDLSLPADYAGSAAAEIAVYRPSEGSVWLRGANQPLATGLGVGLPSAADHAGGAKVQPAVLALDTGEWRLGGLGVRLSVDPAGLWADRLPAAAAYTGARPVQLGVLTRGTDARFDIEGRAPLALGPSTSATPSIVAPAVVTHLDRLTDHARSCSYLDDAVPEPRPPLPAHCPGSGVVGDVTGNGAADLVLHVGGMSDWYLLIDPTGVVVELTGPQPEIGEEDGWPIPNDLWSGVGWDVSGDYTGDGRTDLAVVDAYTWTWFTPIGEISFLPPAACDVGDAWGDWPEEGAVRLVQADYTGDGVTDPAWWCGLDGSWHVLGLDPMVIPPGAPGPDLVEFNDVPLPADLTGNGVAEPVVYRPTEGAFYRFGDPTPLATGLGVGWPYAADLDGDGIDEVGVLVDRRRWGGSGVEWNTAGGDQVVVDAAPGTSCIWPIPGPYAGSVGNRYALGGCELVVAIPGWNFTDLLSVLGGDETDWPLDRTMLPITLWPGSDLGLWAIDRAMERCAEHFSGTGDPEPICDVAHANAAPLSG